MKPEHRLHDWKIFRESLTTLAKEEQLIETAEYWSVVPLVKYYLNFDKPDTWPTPWELLNEGQFCRSGVAFMMYKTLELCKGGVWTPEQLKLVLINDLTNEETYLVLVVEDEYVLNYDHARVVRWSNIEKFCEVICEY
jgi:hypothetical protein